MKTDLKKNIARILSSFTIASVLFAVPMISFAQTNTSLALQCDPTATTTDASGLPPCSFNTLIDAGTRLIDWMFYVSVPIMVALLAYAGILYMTGIEKNIGRAKDMFIKVALGFTIMLVAFVCVNTIVGWIGNSTFTTTSSGAPSNPAVLLQQ